MSSSVNWSKLNGFQLELLWEAICHDFGENTLDQAMATKFNKRLDHFVSSKEDFRSQVFTLLRRTQMEGWTDRFFVGLRQANPGGPGLRDFSATLGLTAGASSFAPAGWKLEDLLRPDKGFIEPDGWLTKLAGLRRQVCRIEHPSRPAKQPGFGTGWLVGSNLMLTNYHVVEHFAPVGAQDSSEIVCRFDVPEVATDRDNSRSCGFSKDWVVASGRPGAAERGDGDDPPSADELDFALVRLAEPVGNDEVAPNLFRGRVDLTQSASASKSGDVLLIVQHPSGQPQRFAFGNVRKSQDEGRRLLHDANTLPGSSGSPVVDVKLDILALHHAGGKANQAVPIHLVGDRLSELGISLA